MKSLRESMYLSLCARINRRGVVNERVSEGQSDPRAPESCGGAREGIAEALTGLRTGLALRRESTLLRGADAKERRKAISCASISQDAQEPRAVRDPVHVRKHLAREAGDPSSARGFPNEGGIVNIERRRATHINEWRRGSPWTIVQLPGAIEKRLSSIHAHLTRELCSLGRRAV